MRHGEPPSDHRELYGVFQSGAACQSERQAGIEGISSARRILNRNLDRGNVQRRSRRHDQRSLLAQSHDDLFHTVANKLPADRLGANRIIRTSPGQYLRFGLIGGKDIKLVIFE